MQMTGTNAERAATAATLLEYWLTSTAVRVDRRARPIAFRFLVADGPLAFSFVPAAQGPLIRTGAVEGAAATVRTHPAALLRLLLEPAFSPQDAGFPFLVEGDAEAFLTLSSALASARSGSTPLGIRLQAPTRERKRQP